MVDLNRKSSPGRAALTLCLCLCLCLCLGAGLGGLAGCDDQPASPPPTPEVSHLWPVQETILLRPGLTQPILFELATAGGAPIAGEEVRFSILADPEMAVGEAKGATLISERDVTDAAGRAGVTVRAGLPTIFRVHARTRRAADADAVIVVGSAEYGSAEIMPLPPTATTPGSGGGASGTLVDILLFDGAACATTGPATTRPPVRGVKVVPPGGVALYTSIATSGSHAIVGRARDPAGAIQALGCVDLPGASLIPDGVVRVALPLAEAKVSPLGRFAVQSRFRPEASAKGFDPSSAVAAPWIDLADCPLDPASLLLDCTIDALGGGGPADPLDCLPSSEGPLGDRLAARRGKSSAGGCHAATDALDQPSLDAVAAALFPARGDARVLTALASLGADAADVMRTIKLESSLVITATSVPGRHQADHTLDLVELTTANGASRIPPAWLGIPALTAFHVPVYERSGAVQIAPHGWTLRLGTVGRHAFGELALGPRGLPASSVALVEAIVGLASMTDRKSTSAMEYKGCAAVDLGICEAAGEAAGCLEAACTRGITALATRLDAGFLDLDGDALDFHLEGSAVAVDVDSNGDAERLGDPVSTPARPGLWSAELRARGGAGRFTGLWSGERR